MPWSKIISIIIAPPKAIEDRNPERLPMLKLLILNKVSRNIGSATLFSTKRKAISKAAPEKRAVITHRLAQPIDAAPYGTKP
jgi:hypothetical protein